MEKKKAVLGFIISTILVIGGAFMSFGFQTNFGDIDVSTVSIQNIDGDTIVGKLYRPLTATPATPAPGVIGLHGYNNDKDVMRPYAIEMAKHGICVLTVDTSGHGDSEGYLDAITSGLTSASVAYDWLADQAFVNGSWMGIYGHSMGNILTYYLATMKPDHDALGLIAFRPDSFHPPINFTIHHNVIHLWAQYEEFIRDGENQQEMMDAGLAAMQINSGDPDPQFYTTYGDISAGTGYRVSYSPGTTHPGLTASPTAVRELAMWMMMCLNGVTESDAENATSSLTFAYVEIFGGIALLGMFASMIFLAILLLNSKYFAEVAQPMTERVLVEKKGEWWIYASLNTLLGGLIFVFFTHASEWWKFNPSGEGEPSHPWDMGVFNNWVGFYVVNVGVMLLFLMLFFLLRRAKEKTSINAADFGITYPNAKGWNVFGKTVLLAAILFAWMYGLAATSQHFLNVEFRCFWTFAKAFTTERLVKFLVYFPIIFAFFFVNGGLFLFGEIRQKELDNPRKTTFIWWAKAVFAMLTGLLIVFAIQYLGFIFGYGPTFNRWWAPTIAEITAAGGDAGYLGFAPMMPIQLMSFIPMGMISMFILVYFFRKTGKIYLGSLIGALITTWFLAVGTVIGYGI